MPNKDLQFGFSHWYPNGQFIGLFGIAHHNGDHWDYQTDLDADDLADRCKVLVGFRPNGAPYLIGDKTAMCGRQGGAETEIGSVEFPPKSYEGQISSELKDAEFFFNNAGKCG